MPNEEFKISLAYYHDLANEVETEILFRIQYTICIIQLLEVKAFA